MEERRDKSYLEELILVNAREALTNLWQEIHRRGCRARGWGSKKREDGNPLRGSNITLATEEEVIIINLKDGQLQVHSYSENPDTKLGKKVTAILRDKGLIK